MLPSGAIVVIQAVHRFALFPRFVEYFVVSPQTPAGNLWLSAIDPKWSSMVVIAYLNPVTAFQERCVKTHTSRSTDSQIKMHEEAPTASNIKSSEVKLYRQGLKKLWTFPRQALSISERHESRSVLRGLLKHTTMETHLGSMALGRRRRSR